MRDYGFACYKMTINQIKYILCTTTTKQTRDYQAILEWVADGGTAITDNGGGE
jgi:hypothetical protein